MKSCPKMIDSWPPEVFERRWLCRSRCGCGLRSAFLRRERTGACSRGLSLP